MMFSHRPRAEFAGLILMCLVSSLVLLRSCCCRILAGGRAAARGPGCGGHAAAVRQADGPGRARRGHQRAGAGQAVDRAGDEQRKPVPVVHRLVQLLVTESGGRGESGW